MPEIYELEEHIDHRSGTQSTTGLDGIVAEKRYRFGYKLVEVMNQHLEEGKPRIVTLGKFTCEESIERRGWVCRQQLTLGDVMPIEMQYEANVAVFSESNHRVVDSPVNSTTIKKPVVRKFRIQA